MRAAATLALSIVFCLPGFADEPQTVCGDPFTKATLESFEPADVVGPRIEAGPAMQLLGLEREFDETSDAFAIDRLWEEFAGRRQGITDPVDNGKRRRTPRREPPARAARPVDFDPGITLADDLTDLEGDDDDTLF